MELDLTDMIDSIINEILEKPLAPTRIRFYNNLVTKIWWNDGTTTKVICNSDDVFDEKNGVMMCTLKKLMGNTGHYNREISRWIRDFGQSVDKKAKKNLEEKETLVNKPSLESVKPFDLMEELGSIDFDFND